MIFPSTRKMLLAAAVAGVVGVASLVGPADASHAVIDFETHDCGSGPLSTGAPSPPDPGATPTPTPTPEPADNCMPAEGERIVGTRNIEFSVRTDGARPIRSVAAYILSEEDGVPDANGGQPVYKTVDFSRGQGVATHEAKFTWNSAEQTPYNGRYQILVEVFAYDSFVGNNVHRHERTREDLQVDNPPKAVDAPKIAGATSAAILVEWNHAKEPDIEGYIVYRAVTPDQTRPQPGALQRVGSVTEPSFRDTRVSEGVHWYAVQVVRRSVVTPDTGIRSPMSPLSGPGQAREETAPPEGPDGEEAERPATQRRPIPYRSLRPPNTGRASTPDAPFSYQLPYDDAPPGFGGIAEESDDVDDPRGPILPVAVGMFLLSSALTVGRMPY